MRSRAEYVKVAFKAILCRRKKSLNASNKKCQNVWVGTFVLIFKLICVARTPSINGLIPGTHYLYSYQMSLGASRREHAPLTVGFWLCEGWL